MTVICRVLLLGASFLISPAMMELAASQEPGNRELGRLIAQEWCSDCHRINERAMPRVGTAPDFSSIARMPSVTEMSLRVFLLTPHGTMPRYQFTSKECRMSLPTYSA